MSEAAVPMEVTVHDVKRLIDSGAEFLLLDVRRPEEHATARIPGAKLVPLSDLPRALPDLQEFAGRPVIAHCHHGVRSLQAAAWLRSQGIENAQSMAGGIDQWSLKIDPSVARY